MYRLMVVVLSALTFFESSINAKEIISNNNAQERFQLSDDEKRDIEKILEQTKISGTLDLNNVLARAFDGNPIAMYIAGQCSLMGAGTIMNRAAANLYFEMAASLGYAPALYEVSSYYVCEKKDPLLSLVYLNLAISHGHREYRDLYYQQTEILTKVAGPSVVREVERIALEKTIEISKFTTKIEEKKNTYKPALSLIGGGITNLDMIYTEGYWKQFFQSEESWKSFFGETQRENCN